jgi:hypothetical protein
MRRARWLTATYALTRALTFLLLDRICRVVKIALKQMKSGANISKATQQIVWARTLVLAQSQDDFS